MERAFYLPLETPRDSLTKHRKPLRNRKLDEVTNAGAGSVPVGGGDFRGSWEGSEFAPKSEYPY
jgi:hypothetical protein